MLKTKRLAISLVILALVSLSVINNYAGDEQKKVENKHEAKQEAVNNHEAIEAGHAEDAHMEEGQHEGGHNSDMSPLFFVIIALIIGAATRQMLSKTFLPFTVSLLLIGIILGILE